MSSEQQHRITGVFVEPGHPVPLRQEVDAWYTSKDPTNVLQVHLFLRALRKFQDMPPSDTYSYFQIAGIHGLPYTPWNEDTKPQTPDEGYCTHGSILFPCWHRPYILLVEKRLQKIMVEDIIPEYPPNIQSKLRDAADKWRLPYWDWAADAPKYSFPLIAASPTILVLMPNGPVRISNPMYKFSMPKGERMDKYWRNPGTQDKEIEPPFGRCVGTSRCAQTPSEEDDPRQTAWIDGDVHNNIVLTNLQSPQWYDPNAPPDPENPPFSDPGTLTEAVYRLFTKGYLSKYSAFATTEYLPDQKPQEYSSCEYIHNNVHNWVGGFNYGKVQNFDGQMNDVPVAAYDPIFWLHHSNIDRQFAIWQELYDQSWFDDNDLSDPGNFYIPKGKVVKPSDPLAPFRDDHGEYYTSNSVRNFFGLGYSYPELQPWLKEYNPGGSFNRTLYINALREKINRLYGSVRNVVLGGRFTGMGGLDNTDYIVNVVYDKFALGGKSFTVHIHIGPEEGHNNAKTDADAHAQASVLPHHSTHVGSVYSFGGSPLPTSDTPGCENCSRQASKKFKATGQVPITSVLANHVADSTKPLNSLHRDEVTDYLRKHLHWKITARGQPDVDINLVDLEITVAVGDAEHHDEDNRLSMYSNYEVLRPITEGRPGGV